MLAQGIVGLCGGGGGVAGLTTLSQVLSSTSTGSTITVPGGIQAGDLLVLWDRAAGVESAPSSVVPGGFTSLSAAVGTLSRIILSYKLATGSEGGTNLTGMNGNSTNDKVLAVFRGNAAIASVTSGSPAAQATDGNPNSQVAASSGGVSPLVVVAGYGGANVNPRTMSPAKDGEINSSARAYLAWKIYDTAPADVTSDMDDEGIGNGLASGYLACA